MLKSSVSVGVFDLTGKQIILDKSEAGNSFQINVQQWTSGIYILRVTDEAGNSSVVKWVKE